MSLEHILLGILRKPASGYEVKGAFDSVFSHFWAAELSQIYRTLKHLEREGCLRSRQEASEKGPPKKNYAIMRKGRKRLRAWLLDGPQLGDERITFLAQTFLLAELQDHRAAHAFMKKLRDEFARRLEVLRGIESEWRSSDPTYPDCASDEDFYAQLTLQLGLEKAPANLAWAEECLARIERRIKGREKP